MEWMSNFIPSNLMDTIADTVSKFITIIERTAWWMASSAYIYMWLT